MFAIIVDTTGTQLCRFLLVDDPHATNVSLTLLDSTRFVALWTANKEVYARTFTISGQPMTDLLTIHADVEARRDWADACVNNGKVLFVWADARNWGHGYDIYGSMHELTEITSVPRNKYQPGLPTDFFLAQNYPNPFNAETVIRYHLPTPSFVMLEIYNLLGQKVRTLVAAQQAAGNYRIHWDGTSDSGAMVSAGIYYGRMKTSSFQRTIKMVYLP